MRPTVLLVLLLGILAASHRPMAAPPASTVQAMNAFEDRVDGSNQLTDRIYSDGGGWYVDGASTVGNKLFTLLGQQDWVLSFASKNAPRSVWVSFADRLDGSGPTGTFRERPVLNTHDIGSIGVGETETRPVTMTTSQGKLHFDTQYGSTVATVHRVSATEWVVEVSPTTETPEPFAALDRVTKGVTTLVGTYSMPFRVNVVCVNTTTCLP
jgi:hypothetical protein